jgi:cytidyltransferase-like protein
VVGGNIKPDALPDFGGVTPDVWIVDEEGATPGKRAHAEARGIPYQVIQNQDLRGFPVPAFVPPSLDSAPRRVIVTGCFDWFHSGHVRFFEEVGAYGDLYVIVGHDANIRLLKGAGHPLLPQDERRYVAGSIKYVQQALISSGDGWLDADPEIQKLKPNIYAVNEEGDQGGKREYCRTNGIEYLVLRRVPAPGLLSRSSTDLRGF